MSGDDIRTYTYPPMHGETRTVVLCGYHRAIRARIGAVLTDKGPGKGCEDCSARTPGPTVLDRMIEADDAARAKAEPEPVRVLPGQRRLFE